MKETGMDFGRTVKKKFLAALVGGFLLMGAMAAVFGMTGTAFALPLGGMGDFYVEFNKLQGDGFELTPHIGETGNSDATPLVRNKIDSATVNGLHIYKDLKMPTGKWIRVNIKASQPTEIKGLIQDAHFIDADLKFNSLAVEEHNTSGMSTAEAFKKNWGQKADNVTITEGKIVTDYLFQNMVNLQGAKISIANIDGPDTSGGNSSGGGDGVANSKNNNNGNRDHHKDQTAVAGNGGGNDNGSGSSGMGGMLPTTASDSMIMISIGALLVAAGIIFVLRRKIFGRLGKHEL